MGERDLDRASVGMRPEDGFPVLREAVERDEGYPVDTTGHAFQPAALGQAGQYRWLETGFMSLECGEQAVVIYGLVELF